MKHYGDITKIDGSKVEPVWIVTGGSPCQDLSVAGKRKGLDGERSGLFMEQLRVIKEMRENDRRKRRTNEPIQPRFMVWENVSGAFSSNGGEDFRVVLEETARVCDTDAIIPRPYGLCDSWTPSGAIVGNGWSIAWRVHDAQFWGVPQRRKRICLVADFGGESAPKILFESKSLSRDIEPSRKERKRTTEPITDSIGETSQPIIDAWGGDMYNYKLTGKVVNSLTTNQNATSTQPTVCYGICSYESNAMKSNNPNSGVYEAETSRTLDNNGGIPSCNQIPCVMTSDGDVAGTLDASYYKGCGERSGIKRTYIVDQGGGKSQCAVSEDVTPTLATTHGGEPVVSYGFDQGAARDVGALFLKEKAKTCTVGTCPSHRNGVATYGFDRTVVRRLTPLECERLQGFPDGWTDIGDWTDSKGKKHKGEADSPRYKALGNSIALPFWQWMAERMVNVLREDGVENPTMASLFDGIGGFPLVYSRAGCEPIWASEIEEFPIAVTKLRFGED